jgi:hypothetical protein
MDDEEWTANMPEHFLRGYVQLDQEGKPRQRKVAHKKMNKKVKKVAKVAKFHFHDDEKISDSKMEQLEKMADEEGRVGQTLMEHDDFEDELEDDREAPLHIKSALKRRSRSRTNKKAASRKNARKMKRVRAVTRGHKHHAQSYE